MSHQSQDRGAIAYIYGLKPCTLMGLAFYFRFGILSTLLLATNMATAQTTQSLFDGVVPGMTVRVHQKIKDVNPKGEEKERVQMYEGMVIKRKGGKQTGATVTVRKISNGVGVEKIFPINLPSIVKVEKVKQAQVRRSKLYYLRTAKKKLKEKALA